MADQVEDSCLSSYDHFFRPDLLAGKVAFITGGGSGIGFTIAEIFMRHGCTAVIGSRKLARVQKAADKLEKATSQKCFPLQMDVRKVDQVEAAVKLILQKFKKIDIVVNNAAGNFLCPANKLSYNGMKTVFEIDTFGTFNVSKAVYNSWFKDHGGSVVNITATLHHAATPFQCHAGSAKAAIEAMTRHLAVEWGPDGVRLNCVAPGAIKDTVGFSKLGGPQLVGETSLGKIPLERVGTRRDVADAVLYLGSNASSYVTGTTLVVDGGSWMSGATVLNDMKKMMSKL
ncbi:peroxisomal 2,4-dienoyl-CoA reductase-like [Actinia tenebrosa]|uniref:Peroxisomal 2,4-dienoyl-CoA reductase [(3E)-enoyl-CoA-producing] n=1 Tax=Actinia tenebrosa TaxID=6105 RepID=A0A6P8ILH0_ACTTE|nr:peroxisomal 2,4-dienoyl-CoA reductase-like [Actinia tenebrosa]